MIQLESVQRRPFPKSKGFPFTLPVLQSLEELRFETPVTLLVGENGSGKSTVLEGLACAADMVVVGSESTRTDKSLAHARELAKYFRLGWKKRTHRGFFLRAEDFFGYARRLNEMRAGMQADLDEIDAEYKDRSDYARGLARSSTLGQLGALQRRYGEGLDVHSHGESFLELFQARFVPQGLYLLDEPEAPLSPIRQLAFIKMVMGMVEQEGQFVIATHSPILMAFPGATLLNFDGGAIRPAHYEDLEHVRLMRDFLQNPEAFLRNL